MTEEDDNQLSGMLEERLDDEDEADGDSGGNAAGAQGRRGDDDAKRQPDDDPASTSPGSDTTNGTSGTSTENADDATSQQDFIPSLPDIDVTKQVSRQQLARALMVDDYHREDPPVPYATWRGGGSTGRIRTSMEMNRGLDVLVDQVQTEFVRRHDTSINKSDVRELALAYGLAHPDEIFDMAKEWGLHYDS
jgi:hypothetical protein